MVIPLRLGVRTRVRADVVGRIRQPPYVVLLAGVEGARPDTRLRRPVFVLRLRIDIGGHTDVIGCIRQPPFETWQASIRLVRRNARRGLDRMLNVAAVRAWGIAFDKPFPPVIVK